MYQASAVLQSPSSDFILSYESQLTKPKRFITGAPFLAKSLYTLLRVSASHFFFGERFDYTGAHFHASTGNLPGSVSNSRGHI